jgi:4-hydroxythreonine-4-phosphate dehydrogenase
VVLAPAFPGTGRITRGGQVLVGGVPLERTEVWRDAGMPGPADPAAMLRSAGLDAAILSLGEVRSGPDALARAAAVADAVVCDAETEGDLSAIADAGARLGRPVVWAGSAGLARHLPAALALRPEPAPGGRRAAAVSGPILFLVGSRSSVARGQAEVLAREPGVMRIDLDPRELLAGRAAAAAATLAQVLGSGRDALAVLGDAPVAPERGPELALAAARLVAPHAPRLGGVFVTGGEMARALVGVLGASGVHLLGEVEPGVPLGIADTAPPLPLVTKAGAFGSPATGSRARAALAALAGERDAAAPGGTLA